LRVGASAVDIVDAYRREALRRHTDRGGDGETMVRLNVARDYLVAAGLLGDERRDRQVARRSR
jgi:hypothetical protein